VCWILDGKVGLQLQPALTRQRLRERHERFVPLRIDRDIAIVHPLSISRFMYLRVVLYTELAICMLALGVPNYFLCSRSTRYTLLWEWRSACHLFLFLALVFCSRAVFWSAVSVLYYFTLSVCLHTQPVAPFVSVLALVRCTKLRTCCAPALVARDSL